MTGLRQIVGPALIILALVAAYSGFHTSKATPSPPGWEELVLCSFLTSIDSKKSLTLSDDHSAELTDDAASRVLQAVPRLVDKKP